MNRSAGVAVGSLLAVAAGFVVLVLGYDVRRIESPTMAPTLMQGSQALFRPVAGDHVRRGDIVRTSLPWSERPGLVVFRVIAVGGDRLVCCSGDRLMLNGKPLKERYIQDGEVRLGGEFEATVPAGRVFLAGDSRALANDSRLHREYDDGTVALGAVEERLVAVVWVPWRASFRLADPAGVVALGAAVAVLGGLVVFVITLARILRRSTRRVRFCSPTRGGAAR